MAFAVRNLSVLAYANGFTLWHYKGAGDSVKSLSNSGFFRSAGDMLSDGDMVLVSARDGGTVLVVNATEGGLVTAPLH